MNVYSAFYRNCNYLLFQLLTVVKMSIVVFCDLIPFGFKLTCFAYISKIGLVELVRTACPFQLS